LYQALIAECLGVKPYQARTCVKNDERRLNRAFFSLLQTYVLGFGCFSPLALGRLQGIGRANILGNYSGSIARVQP